MTKSDDSSVTEYEYDKNDRLLTAGSIKYTYDANGNTLSEVKDDGTVTNYKYNYNNDLIEVEGKDKVSYEYDFTGERVSKTVNNEKTNYLVDRNRDYSQVLEEYTLASDIKVAYVYGDDLISQERSGSKSYYLYDGKGSTRTLTDQLGNVTDTYTYDAFGQLMNTTGTTVNSYLYTGEQYDANIGFYYLRARYMNPAVGRFMTMDSYEGRVADPISLHKYLYASDNPVAYSDPSGHMSLGEVMVSESISNILDGISTCYRVLNYIEKVEEVVDTFNAVTTAYNLVATGQLKTIYEDAFENPVGQIDGVEELLTSKFWEDVFIDLTANKEEIVIKALSRPDKLAEFITMTKRPTSNFVIFMPTPPVKALNVEAQTISSGIKFKGKPLKLYFGAKGNVGRVVGFGMLPNNNNKSVFQVFRMDYHNLHETKEAKIPGLYWSSGRFHYHVYSA
ncbi:MAG: RHS repeat domain-containing protein [Clostridiaceae bacterium]